jgi:osmotically-inducible protein OsmY
VFKKEIIVVAVVILTGVALAAPYEPDNTKVNERDAKGATLTSEDQSKGSAKDIELTRLIRQEIVSDKSLSRSARNIKIITLSGIVTLRGPVDSQQEKQRIDVMVQKMAGVQKVDNQLEIKTKAY